MGNPEYGDFSYWKTSLPAFSVESNDDVEDGDEIEGGIAEQREESRSSFGDDDQLHDRLEAMKHATY